MSDDEGTPPASPSEGSEVVDDGEAVGGTVIRLKNRPRRFARPHVDPSDKDLAIPGTDVKTAAGDGTEGARSEGDGTRGDSDEETSAASSSSVVVDQRMRQRRIDVQRSAGQRRLQRLMWALAPLAVLVVGLALAHSSLLDVDRIEVEGAQQVSSATVRWASGIDPGDSLATLDAAAAEGRIERLARVDQARVVRSWPGTVRITVAESQPGAVVVPHVARGDEAEGPPLVAMVDAGGRVVDIGRVPPPGLMVLTGVKPPLGEGDALPRAARPALALAVALADRLPGVATSVSADLEATLTGEGVARFGEPGQIDEKLASLQAVLSEVDVSCLAELDLRVPSRPALSRLPC
jgi:cell division protein FtsQ